MTGRDEEPSFSEDDWRFVVTVLDDELARKMRELRRAASDQDLDDLLDAVEDLRLAATDIQRRAGAERTKAEEGGVFSDGE